MKRLTRKQIKNNRLDWRDPDMPVVRKVLINDEWIIKEIKPNQIQKYYERKIEGDYEFEWRDDPTYNLKRKKD